jgi:hypothetical protein
MRMNGATDVDEIVTLFSHVPPATPEGGGDVPTTWATPT